MPRANTEAKHAWVEPTVTDLPASTTMAIKEATRAVQTSAIAFAMITLGVIARTGAIIALIVIGRRRVVRNFEGDEVTKSSCEPTRSR